jgi:hypothetical protein
MPKVLFYTGTALCLLLALASAIEATRELQDLPMAFVSLHGSAIASTALTPIAILAAMLAGAGLAAIFLRMAALLAARNLFAAFVSLFAVGCSTASLAWVLLLQTRMLLLIRRGATGLDGSLRTLGELHFAGFMMLGYFLSLALLALRPYFRIQASRVLSALVFFPLPLFLLIQLQDMTIPSPASPLPATSPASQVFFALLAVLFFAIAVHCIRHRYLFLEMTNLRELLDTRIDPTHRGGRPVRIAFDA